MALASEKTMPKPRFTVRRLMLLVLGVAVLLSLSGIGRGITSAKVGRIRPGMTQGQVEAILGPPNLLAAPRGEAFWDENRLLGTRYVKVHVFFDSDGRVERVDTGGFWRSPWWKFW
jgi:hypothetical protein